MMDIQECLRQGLLKHVTPNRQEIEKERQEARRDWSQAKITFENGSHKWSIIQAYYAMFHAARAVLKLHGYKERRHAALVIFLEDLAKRGALEAPFVDDFKAALFAREEADYEATYSKERAEQLLVMAEEFVERMKRFTGTR